MCGSVIFRHSETQISRCLCGVPFSIDDKPPLMIAVLYEQQIYLHDEVAMVMIMMMVMAFSCSRSRLRQ